MEMHSEQLSLELEWTLLSREDEIIKRMELIHTRNMMTAIKDQKFTSAQIQIEIDNCNRRKRAIVEQRNPKCNPWSNLRIPGIAL